MSDLDLRKASDKCKYKHLKTGCFCEVRGGTDFVRFATDKEIISLRF